MKCLGLTRQQKRARRLAAAEPELTSMTMNAALQSRYKLRRRQQPKAPTAGEIACNARRHGVVVLECPPVLDTDRLDDRAHLLRACLAETEE